ncbi:hypothetical protein [Salinispora arenicola]|uniref:Uncharacterized protein n=2 Tax=Salinispora arenicola TaxID=168697 RepID=A0A542XK00_SALAC|nr:hypothetical protein [Salinispora arenicola]MCN0154868.1 hypothetical protein [Salinispora arenicola]MCN0180721.1 hypothetical protein [Salinispora arenicola]TQL36158.1 hypothetical protein FB564_1240 [Salinispora arenicola]GIM83778.1 hypothetical protein Sar04_13960 [Salinispora arenicola]
MYAWIWRKLPFGLPGKLAGSVLLAAVTVTLLWFVVFPWAEPLLPFDDVQVTNPAGPGDPGAPGPLPGEGQTPTEDGHDLPYDTDENNPPPSPEE